MSHTKIATKTPWHHNLTNKMSWASIGLMSQATKQRGRLADERTLTATTAYLLADGAR